VGTETPHPILHAYFLVPPKKASGYGEVRESHHDVQTVPVSEFLGKIAPK